MAVKEIRLIACKCLKCGWSWYPRTPAPAMCPKCKRWDWTIPGEVKSRKSPKKVNKSISTESLK